MQYYLLLNILKSKYTWLGLAVFILFVTVYSIYNENKTLKLEKSILSQNLQAQSDSLTKTKDYIQTVTSRVDNLNLKNSELQGNNNNLKNEYTALKIKYLSSIDSIKILNQNANGKVIGDSIGIVAFSGKKNIVTYDGETEINIKTKESKLNKLTLAFSELEAGSELIYNEDSKLWAIRAFSKTDGVKIIGYSTIDTETFKKLKGISTVNKNKSLYIGGLVNRNFIAPGISINISNWNIGANYILLSKNTNDSYYDKLVFSINYAIF